jgi:hypothetical protein
MLLFYLATKNTKGVQSEFLSIFLCFVAIFTRKEEPELGTSKQRRRERSVMRMPVTRTPVPKRWFPIAAYTWIQIINHKMHKILKILW